MSNSAFQDAGIIEEGASSFANAFADISQSNFIAEQFKMNEQMANIQAGEAITQGTIEQQVSQQKTGELSGEQKASEAAQGVEVHSGTAEITRSQTAEIGGEDYATIGNNAMMKALGFKINALNDKSQAEMETSAGINKAANTLLSGANEMYSSSMKAMSYDQSSNPSSYTDPSTEPGYNLGNPSGLPGLGN